ncbi:MAG: glycosyltransferase family 2 protein [Acidiferrobacterales bacterium]
MPYFSIVIPMFNRASFIARTLHSCLNQDFHDFEIIIVDDASTDDSVSAAREFSDHRISLYRHEINRGVCPARNSGIQVAKGRWIICLDSDDELLPGALSVMHRRTSETESSISSVRFMCVLESGELSPNPPLVDEILDYHGYLRWLDTAIQQRQESLICVRRTTFNQVRYPEDRSLEMIYHLDFSHAFLTRNSPDVVRMYHQDADNSLCNSFSQEKALRNAPDHARNSELILLRHGDGLGKWAPHVYLVELKGGATNSFLANKRIKGLKYAARYVRQRPFSPDIWIILLFGLLGRQPLAWMKAAASFVRSRTHGTL